MIVALKGESIKVKARVQLTVEVDLGDVWSEDCSISQLFQQAGNAAKERLRAVNNLMPNDTQLVGEPKILAIITDNEG